MSVILPDRDALLELHRQTITRHGGAPGIRDGGALDAALARPRQVESYDASATIYRITAALAVSLTRHRHPFVDGNKRMGLISTYVMLALNGIHLDASEIEAHRGFLAVSEGTMDDAALAAWLERHAVAQPR